MDDATVEHIGDVADEIVDYLWQTTTGPDQAIDVLAVVSQRLAQVVTLARCVATSDKR